MTDSPNRSKKRSSRDRDLPDPTGPVEVLPQQPLPAGERVTPTIKPVAPPPKLQRALQRLLEREGAAARHEILIRFRADMTPQPQSGKQPPTCAEAAARLAALDRRKSEESGPLVHFLKNHCSIEVLDVFTSINTLLVRMPLRLVRPLAAHKLVLYQELRYAEEPPPGFASTAAQGIEEGRTLIGSDTYRTSATRAVNTPEERIALLDTGVDLQLGGADLLKRVEHRFTCLGSAATDCQELNPNDGACKQHGTLVAAVLTGDTTDPYQGVTTIPVDSYQVYRSASNDCELDTAAVIRALEHVRQARNPRYTVVAALIQGDRHDRSAIVAKTRELFDAGISIIAPTGNYNALSHAQDDRRDIILVPARGSCVIGVGAVEASSPDDTDALQRWGLVDTRTKPDVQGPTTYRALDPTGRPGHPQVELDATSGATPYIAGAAALLHKWLADEHPKLAEPGMVYALLILAGQTAGVDKKRGAGLVQLPQPHPTYVGKNTIQAGNELPINLTINAAAADSLDAAIWWAKPDNDPSQRFQQIFLELSPPAGCGNAVSASRDATSVFQRVHVKGPICPGTWQLRIKWGINVTPPANPPSQDVYWAVHLHVPS